MKSKHTKGSKGSQLKALAYSVKKKKKKALAVRKTWDLDFAVGKIWFLLSSPFLFCLVLTCFIFPVVHACNKNAKYS